MTFDYGNVNKEIEEAIAQEKLVKLTGYKTLMDMSRGEKDLEKRIEILEAVVMKLIGDVV